MTVAYGDLPAEQQCVRRDFFNFMRWILQTLTYARIPLSLQPYIGTIYSGIAEPGLTTLPALMAQLWVCKFPVYWQAPGSDLLQRLPTVTLMGPLLRAHAVHVATRGQIMGIGFWPAGWTRLVRLSADSMADAAADATTLWPSVCQDLLCRLEVCKNWPEQAEALLEICRETLQRSRHLTLAGKSPVTVTKQTTLSEETVPVIDDWLSSHAPLDNLTAALGVSVRQAERITALTHGASPRLLRNRQRALRTAARSISHPSLGHDLWRDYADQSHLIREFRRYIGSTPSAFGKENSIGNSIFSKSWEGDLDHPLNPHTGTRQQDSNS